VIAARLGRWACRLLAFVILFWGVGTVVQLVAAPVIVQQAEAKPCQDPFINPSCTGKTLDPRTGSPSLGDCKTTPSPQAPGDGLSGSIDSGDPHPDPKAAKDSIYERYGFPPSWHTYDLGCTSAIDPDSWWAAVDTNIGNWLKGFATSLVALANALHRFVDPPTFMHHFDPMIVSATDAMHRAIYEPWIAVSVLLIGAGLMMSSHKGNLPKTVTAAAWAVFVMGVATALWEYPLWAGRTVDSGETWVSNQIDQSILGKSSTDSTQARAELLVENVLYKQWMLGEVGSASPVQHVHDQALALLGDQAYTYEEAAKIAQHGDAANKINEGKAKDFKAKASDLQKHYPNAYSHLKGQAGGRIGAGGESFVAALCVVPFMIMADLLKILSFFIIRWLVVLSPAIAVFAMFWRWRSVFWAVANRAGTAVLNALMFGVGAALATLSTGIMFSGTVGLPTWASMLMCLIVNIILWQMFKPLRHLAAQVSPASVLTRQGTHHRRGYWGHRYRRYRRHYRRMNRAVGRLDGALVGANGGGGRHALPDDDEDDESYVPEKPRRRSRLRPCLTRRGRLRLPSRAPGPHRHSAGWRRVLRCPRLPSCRRWPERSRRTPMPRRPMPMSRRRARLLPRRRLTISHQSHRPTSRKMSRTTCRARPCAGAAARRPCDHRGRHPRLAYLGPGVEGIPRHRQAAGGGARCLSG
jgi:hypothetical protein